MAEIANLRAEEIMSQDVPTIAPQASLSTILQKLLISESPCVVVVDEEQRPLGVVTERDLLPLAMKGRYPPGAALRLVLQDEEHVLDFLQEIRKASASTARQIMTSPVRCVDADMNVADVAATMEAYDFRQLPVTRDGRVIGIITRRLLVRTIGNFRAS